MPVTGLNDVCDEPQWQFPEPFPLDTHFTFVGEHNPSPDATDAIPLAPNNCDDDIVLATTTAPNFLGFFGFPEPDQRLKNLPLRQVPVIAGLDGVRDTLPPPGILPPNPLPPTKSAPNDPILLGDWLRAHAHMWLRCFSDGTAKVKASFHHLIPNGLYTLYGVWKTTLPDTSEPTLVPVAFGGVPNVMVASSRGKARFVRNLPYCPKDPTPDGSVLLIVDLAYHADSNTHGGFPFTALSTVTFRTTAGDTFESTQPPGTVTHVQIGFPITVEPLH